MRSLQLWQVRYNRVCRSTKEVYHKEPEHMQVILGVNGSPLRAIFAAVELTKESHTDWNNNDFIFELPDEDEVTCVHLPSSIEEDLSHQPTGRNPPSIRHSSDEISSPAQFFYKDEDMRILPVPEGTFKEYNMVKPAHPCKEANEETRIRRAAEREVGLDWGGKP